MCTFGKRERENEREGERERKKMTEKDDTIS